MLYTIYYITQGVSRRDKNLPIIFFFSEFHDFDDADDDDEDDHDDDGRRC